MERSVWDIWLAIQRWMWWLIVAGGRHYALKDKRGVGEGHGRVSKKCIGEGMEYREEVYGRIHRRVFKM